VRKKRSDYMDFVRRPEGNRPLGRPRRRWKEIKMHFREKEYQMCGLDSSDSGYSPVMVLCEHGNEHSGSIKCSNFSSG
jgi:hypothetical protein